MVNTLNAQATLSGHFVLLAHNLVTVCIYLAFGVEYV